MLKRFTVSNYRVFENPVTIDFTKVRDYKFSEECIKNGLINKAVLYGKNAVGKTNLGEAILDITMMIPKPAIDLALLRTTSKMIGFLNAKSNEKVAKFEYTFQLNNDEIEYIYEKYELNKLHFESLRINQETLYEFNFDTKEAHFSNFKNHHELALLNFKNWSHEGSVLKYILSHAKLENASTLKQFQHFVGGMFSLQAALVNVKENDLGIKFINEIIIKKNLVHEFEHFLNHAGVDISLKIAITPEGTKALYFDYGDKLLNFLDYASSGTLSLIELYSLFEYLNPTFLYIDEFDANLHFDSAKLMLENFKKKSECQTIITTHNTDLMSNKFMRPDCYFLISPDQILSLADATNRELRQGHNLEKLYHAGEFNHLIDKIGTENE